MKFEIYKHSPIKNMTMGDKLITIGSTLEPIN